MKGGRYVMENPTTYKIVMKGKEESVYICTLKEFSMWAKKMYILEPIKHSEFSDLSGFMRWADQVRDIKKCEVSLEVADPGETRRGWIKCGHRNIISSMPEEELKSIEVWLKESVSRLKKIPPELLKFKLVFGPWGIAPVFEDEKSQSVLKDYFSTMLKDVSNTSSSN